MDTSKKIVIAIGNVIGGWRVLDEKRQYAAKWQSPRVFVECVSCGLRAFRYVGQIRLAHSIGCNKCATRLRTLSVRIGENKVCAKCTETKPVSEFHNDKRRSDGKFPWCKPCANTYTAEIKSNHRSARDPEFLKLTRKYRDRKNFGSDTIFAELIAKQGGGCAVCKKPHSDRTIPRFQIDHDHVTARIRGVLCGGCNKALGHVNDSIPVLEALIEYLRRNADIPIVGGLYAEGKRV